LRCGLDRSFAAGQANQETSTKKHKRDDDDIALPVKRDRIC
jgi:hypothetical protein